MDCLNRAADDAAGNILKFLDIMQYSSNSGSIENTIMKYSTELDQKQLALQKEEVVSKYLYLQQRINSANDNITQD